LLISLVLFIFCILGCLFRYLSLIACNWESWSACFCIPLQRVIYSCRGYIYPCIGYIDLQRVLWFFSVAIIIISFRRCNAWGHFRPHKVLYSWSASHSRVDLAMSDCSYDRSSHVRLSRSSNVRLSDSSQTSLSVLRHAS